MRCYYYQIYVKDFLRISSVSTASVLSYDEKTGQTRGCGYTGFTTTQWSRYKNYNTLIYSHSAYQNTSNQQTVTNSWFFVDRLQKKAQVSTWMNCRRYTTTTCYNISSLPSEGIAAQPSIHRHHLLLTTLNATRRVLAACEQCFNCMAGCGTLLSVERVEGDSCRARCVDTQTSIRVQFEISLTHHPQDFYVQALKDTSTHRP